MGLFSARASARWCSSGWPPRVRRAPHLIAVVPEARILDERREVTFVGLHERAHARFVPSELGRPALVRDGAVEAVAVGGDVLDPSIHLHECFAARWPRMLFFFVLRASSGGPPRPRWRPLGPWRSRSWPSLRACSSSWRPWLIFSSPSAFLLLATARDFALRASKLFGPQPVLRPWPRRRRPRGPPTPRGADTQVRLLLLQRELYLFEFF